VESYTKKQVHRFLLSRDTSAFQDMFNMPTDAKSNAEGRNDEDPIVIYGDSAASFRALMWVLYALLVFLLPPSHTVYQTHI
jgi:hypothetical protein